MAAPYLTPKNIQFVDGGKTSTGTIANTVFNQLSQLAELAQVKTRVWWDEYVRASLLRIPEEVLPHLLASRNGVSYLFTGLDDDYIEFGDGSRALVFKPSSKQQG